MYVIVRNYGICRSKGLGGFLLYIFEMGKPMREKINNKRYGRTRRRTILCHLLFVIITASFTYMG